MSILPCSISMLISSLIFGFPRKYRVGTTLLGVWSIGTKEDSGQSFSPKITVLVSEAAELLEDLGVHVVRCNIVIGDVLAELFTQLGLDLLKVERLHGQSRSTSDSRSVTDNLGSQRFGETAVRLSEVTLEEFDHAFREVQAVSLFENLLLRQVVRDHELGKVTDSLAESQTQESATMRAHVELERTSMA